MYEITPPAPEPNRGLVESVRQTFLTSSGSLTEKALSQRHGVSRAAIREVTAHLEGQGLIERRRKTGSRVRRLTCKEWVDLWDVRATLEALAGRLACVHVTDDDIHHLSRLVAEREQAAKGGQSAHKVNELDVAFHNHIIDVSRNGYVREVTRNLHVFDSVLDITYSAPPAYWVEDERQSFGHSKIVAALACRDPELAEDLLFRHIQGAKKRRMEALIGRLDSF
jgi:DNA-binding GntR family transcriptional regulator